MGIDQMTTSLCRPYTTIADEPAGLEALGENWSRRRLLETIGVSAATLAATTFEGVIESFAEVAPGQAWTL